MNNRSREDISVNTTGNIVHKLIVLRTYSV